MALMYVAAIIVIYTKLISGASFSSVLVQNGGDIVPFDYLNYGAPLTSLSQISAAVDPVLSLPQVSAIVSPCVSPCVIPNPSVPVAPVPTNARLVTYNSPITNVPVVVTKKDEARGYQYAYAVFDQNTGDKKTQSEASDGSLVQGQYSFIQPDGVRREVSYTADDLKGFNAVVRNILVNNGDGSTDSVATTDDKKVSPCDDKSAKITEQLDSGNPEISDATDTNIEQTTTESSVNDNPINNGIITYTDIIKCLQSKLQAPNSVSPLTYIVVPTSNKLC